MSDKIIKEIHKFCNKKSYKEAAQQMGISPQYLCDILLGRRAISEKVAAFFGYKKVIKWKKD
jgi:plasmid maintenance system antidote protein VapI